MASSRSVNITIWADEWFSELKRDEKLLFLYLLTNPFTRLSGTYKISLRQMAFDTGMNQDSIATMLDSFNSSRKLFYRNGWLVLLNFLHHQKYNENMLKCVVSELLDSPAFVSNAIATVIKNSERLRNGFEPFGTILFKREVEEEVEEEVNGAEHAEPEKKKRASYDDAVLDVFSNWQECTKHQKAILDTKRRKFIVDRLKDGFTVEQLKLAAKGILNSDFHMGVNERNTVYNEIKHVYKDAANVEKFIDLADGANQNGNSRSERLRTPAEVEQEKLDHMPGGKLSGVHRPGQNNPEPFKGGR